MKTTHKLYLPAWLLVLVLLVAAFSLSGAAAALRSLTGYLPGVGAVDQSAALRVLAQPVTVARDGYTLSVESAVLDTSRTTLAYRVVGDFPTWDDPARRPRMCQEPARLRLADGRELASTGAEGSQGGGASEWKNLFPAVPASAAAAALVLPCLPDLPAGQSPQDWEIALSFAPAPPKLTVYPVVGVTTPPPTAPEQAGVSASGQSDSPGQPTAPIPPSPTPLASPGAVQPQGQAAFISNPHLTLSGIAALEDGYYLQAALAWDAGPASNWVELPPDALHLFDAAGQETSVWQAEPAAPTGLVEQRRLPLDLQTGPLAAPGPARLVVDYIGLSLPAETSFTIDLGRNPQAGQTWPVDQTLDVNGYTLQVVSAEYVQTPPGQPPMLLLHLAADSSVLAVIAMDLERPIAGTGGAPNSPDVPFRTGWYYPEAFPSGVITATITNLTVRQAGPWSIEWAPPEK